MKTRIDHLSFIVTLFFIFSFAGAAEAQQKTIVLFSPGVEDNTFWKNIETITEAASNDFQYNFEVYYGDDNPDKVAENIRRVTSRTNKPDAVLFPDMSGNGEEFLKISDENGVPALVINMGVNTSEAGFPRQKYKNWIGQIIPDDIDAGYLLAKKLIFEAKENQAYQNGKIRILAITGREQDIPSIERVAGLKKAVDEEANVDLLDILYTNWTSEETEEVLHAKMKADDRIAVVWTASDQMGIAASEVLAEYGKKVNQNVFVGGIDWTTEGLKAVQDSRMTASVGGHLIEGGWATVMLFDYFNGKDFKNESTMLKTPMSVVDENNVDLFLSKIGNGNWGRINFTLYSKVHQNWDKDYRFTIETMLIQLR
jgi:ABC-type sugar transport system substrate-binding protein